MTVNVIHSQDAQQENVGIPSDLWERIKGFVRDEMTTLSTIPSIDAIVAEEVKKIFKIDDIVGNVISKIPKIKTDQEMNVTIEKIVNKVVHKTININEITKNITKNVTKEVTRNITKNITHVTNVTNQHFVVAQNHTIDEDVVYVPGDMTDISPTETNTKDTGSTNTTKQACCVYITPRIRRLLFF